MTRISSDKDIRKVVSRLIQRGWDLKKGKKHHSIVAPWGKKLAIPCTPSDYRAIHNFRKDIKKLANKGLNNA